MIKWSCPLTVKFQHATGEVVLQLVWCSRSSEATRSFRNSKQILANMSAKVLASTHQLSCFPCSSVSKESACSAGDPGLIPGSGRFPGEGNSNTLQYSCLENLIDSGDWWASVHGVCKESSMTERLTLSLFQELLGDEKLRLKSWGHDFNVARSQAFRRYSVDIWWGGGWHDNCESFPDKNFIYLLRDSGLYPTH